MPKSKKPVSAEVAAIIEETVKQTMLRMMAERNAMPDDCYKQTIKRLKAIPILQERVADNQARLDGPLQEKSISIVKYSASGVRADPEEMLEAMRQSLAAHIAADQEEISIVMTALEYVKNDYYYRAVYDSFILRKSDAEIAEVLYCDESTIRRNRGRLTHIIAIRLYGKFAI